MTPLEIMKLGYLMRQAQKNGYVAMAVELERKFDAALIPYLTHAKNMGEDVDGHE